MSNQALADFLQKIKGIPVAVVGIGVSNLPLINLLAKNGALVTACDRRTLVGEEAGELEALGVQLKLGDGYLDGLTQPMIFKTPGMRYDLPQFEAARQRGSLVTSEMEVFFELCPCRIIAVTGSDGKSTTTALIAEMVKAGGHRCFLGGNIGWPLLQQVGEMSPRDIAVLELSSFQLHTMRRSPDVAVVTNVTPNHLDVHKSMEEYVEAKSNIFLYQKPGDRLVLNRDNAVTREFAKTARGDVVWFSRRETLEKGACYEKGIIYLNGRPVLERGDYALPGDHNVEDLMAALCAVEGLVSVERAAAAAIAFKGLPHRIELVREVGGVSWYNNSIASSPARAIACLRSFDKPIVMIAGGYDKKLPFDELGPEVVRNVKLLCLTGDTSDQIYAAVTSAPGYDPQRLTIRRCGDMREAVAACASFAAPGDVVVLCPACASFDRYKNFEERGNHFRALVDKLNDRDGM